jgi:hypothetical protein
MENSAGPLAAWEGGAQEKTARWSRTRRMKRPPLTDSVCGGHPLDSFDFRAPVGLTNVSQDVSGQRGIECLPIRFLRSLSIRAWSSSCGLAAVSRDGLRDPLLSPEATGSVSCVVSRAWVSEGPCEQVEKERWVSRLGDRKESRLSPVVVSWSVLPVW